MAPAGISVKLNERSVAAETAISLGDNWAVKPVPSRIAEIDRKAAVIVIWSADARTELFFMGYCGAELIFPYALFPWQTCDLPPL
jgi:hypothetical protein